MLEKIDTQNYLKVTGICLNCGSEVSRYTCNEPLTTKRPEAVKEDWWSACDNTECYNHYGEGIFQDYPAWERKI